MNITEQKLEQLISNEYELYVSPLHEILQENISVLKENGRTPDEIAIASLDLLIEFQNKILNEEDLFKTLSGWAGTAADILSDPGEMLNRVKTNLIERAINLTARSFGYESDGFIANVVRRFLIDLDVNDIKDLFFGDAGTCHILGTELGEAISDEIVNQDIHAEVAETVANALAHKVDLTPGGAMSTMVEKMVAMQLEEFMSNEMAVKIADFICHINLGSMFE